MQHTDVGAAELLSQSMAGDYHYSMSNGVWYHWNGRVWEPDALQDVYGLAKSTIRTVRALAVENGDSHTVTWANHTEHIMRLRAMVELAQYEDSIPISLADFDTDPLLFNAANGTIDLTTGRIHPHNKLHLMTKYSPVKYDQQATCPKWDTALLDIFEGDVEVIEYVQRAVGYSLTGDTREQSLFFLRGVGSNGKSVFLNVLHAIMGPYARHLHSHTLMHYSNSNNNAKDSDIARMVGARLVTAVESKRGQAWDEELVKQVTGNDACVTARFLRHDTFEFRPTWKTWFCSNYYPDVKSITDVSIWRRLKVVGFKRQFVMGVDCNPNLERELMTELPGILRWAVDGCREWLSGGLGDLPTAMRQEIEQYKKEVDVIGPFLDDVCVVHPKMQIGVGELYSLYERWCRSSAEMPISKIEFGKKVGEVEGVSQSRTRANRVWNGIGVGTVPAARLWDFRDEDGGSVGGIAGV